MEICQIVLYIMITYYNVSPKQKTKVCLVLLPTFLYYPSSIFISSCFLPLLMYARQ
jgi:hypothetical protein